MSNYFKNCTTAEELKKAYHKYAKELHPDNGGNAEEFKKMNSEFSSMFDKLKNTHKSSKGETYERTGEYATHETAEEFMEFINKLIIFSDLRIEIIGSWLWVSGNTKEHIDVFKSLKMWYSGKKQAWYFHFEPFRKSSKKHFSIDELREMFGSEEVKSAVHGNAYPATS